MLLKTTTESCHWRQLLKVATEDNYWEVAIDEEYSSLGKSSVEEFSSVEAWSVEELYSSVEDFTFDDMSHQCQTKSQIITL